MSGLTKNWIIQVTATAYRFLRKLQFENNFYRNSKLAQLESSTWSIFSLILSISSLMKRGKGSYVQCFMWDDWKKYPSSKIHLLNFLHFLVPNSPEIYEKGMKNKLSREIIYIYFSLWIFFHKANENKVCMNFSAFFPLFRCLNNLLLYSVATATV